MNEEEVKKLFRYNENNPICLTYVPEENQISSYYKNEVFNNLFYISILIYLQILKKMSLI